MRRLAAVVGAATLLAAGCSDGDGDRDPVAAPEATAPATTRDATTSTSAAPPGDPVAGQLLRAEPRAAADVPPGARAWDVTYRSTGVAGDLVEVTGVVFAPAGDAGGDRPVVTWAHGTTGVADVCAPSATGTGVHALGALLDAGFVVAATDYEGLGTDDVHPYLVGASAGRSVLDAARAARQVPEAGASTSGPTLAYGHSQGGHAVLFAAELAPSYAPDLALVGVAAAAPPIDLPAYVADAADAPFGFGFFVSAAVGYVAAYPELLLEDVLTPQGVGAAAIVDEACIAVVIGSFLSEPVDAFLAVHPDEVPAWRERIAENVPGVGSEPVPTLVVQGGRDPLVPASRTEAGVAMLCQQGAVVDLRRYEAADHGSVLPAAEADVLAFFADRLAGRPPTSTC